MSGHEVYGFSELGKMYTIVEAEHGDKVRLVSFPDRDALTIEAHDSTGAGVSLAFDRDTVTAMIEAWRAHLGAQS